MNDCPSAQRQALAREIAQFRKNFWSQDPSVRRETFADLISRSETFGQLTAELKQMESSLSLVWPTELVENPIADRLRELAILPRAQQAQRRQHWVAEQRQEWSQLARGFLEKHPTLARIDPSYLSQTIDKPQIDPSLGDSLERVPMAFGRLAIRVVLIVAACVVVTSLMMSFLMPWF